MGLHITILVIASLLFSIKVWITKERWNSPTERMKGLPEKKRFCIIATLLAILQVLCFLLVWEQLVVFQYIDFFFSTVLCAIVDYKHKIIPNELVLFFVLSQILYSFATMPLSTLGWNLLIGLGVMVVLFGISMATRGKIGMGDGKVLGVMVAFAGWKYMLQVIFISLLIAFCWCIVLLLRKKTTLKSELPFMPFVAAGLLVRMVAVVVLI